jgi:hypothetical protein
MSKPNVDIVQYFARPKLKVKTIIGRGKCVFVTSPLPPEHFVTDYGGTKITSLRSLNKITNAFFNDKIVQVPGINNLWYDGSTSETIGKFINHACKCVSNCEFIFDSNNKYRPLVYTRKQIEANEELTLDYGITYDKVIHQDSNYNWLRDYRCPMCNKFDQS